MTLGGTAAVLVVLGSLSGTQLTLDDGLAEARRANARLPIAQLDLVAAAGHARSARGQLYPRLGLQANLIVSPTKFGYGGVGIGPNNIGEERILVTAVQPLWAGGGLRAGIDAAEAQGRAARAAFRVAEKDLDLEVRIRFSEVLKAQEEVRFREEGLERLKEYLQGVRARQAAGQGLLADVLKTEARLSSELADADEARRQLRTSQLQLNALLGRELEAPVVLAPLPEPAAPPEPAPGEPWTQLPDLLKIVADSQAAQAEVTVAQAARLPHVDLTLDAGLWGGGFSVPLPPGGLSQRLRDDLGTSLAITFSWNFLDFGSIAGQVDTARARARQAELQQTLASREAHLRWETARADLASWYGQVVLRRRAVPESRDAYLAAESLYRGGSATAVEVLDAFSALTSASQGYAAAVLALRVAEATALRWSTP